MSKYSVTSLKTKIWLATGGLAFFVCTFGISIWLVLSLFTENYFNSLLVIFLFSATTILIYGWWIANEVSRPVEKVALIAKSIERGVSTSLPKTSGATETDDLLQTLHRNQQQMLNLVGLMEKVADGNLEVALAPLQQNDRLSISFYKLLAKVGESIQAKQELERLNGAIEQISDEIRSIKNGNFDAEITVESFETNEIAETLKFLIHTLNELVEQVKTESKQAQTGVKDVQKSIQNIVSTDESLIREMREATRALKQIPQSVQKISEELLASSQTTQDSIERARSGSQIAQENITAITSLRGQMRETVKRVGRLAERAQEIGKAAKTVEDLAQRTNLIALNASIQTTDAGNYGRKLESFTTEVERLAGRAASTNKQISALNKTIVAEISEIETSLLESVSAAAKLSRFAIETDNSMGKLEKYSQQFLTLQEKLLATSGVQAMEAKTAFANFVASIDEAEIVVNHLKESETQMAQTAASIENLQIAVAEFKSTATPEEEEVAEEELVPVNDYTTLFETEFQP